MVKQSNFWSQCFAKHVGVKKTNDQVTAARFLRIIAKFSTCCGSFGCFLPALCTCWLVKLNDKDLKLEGTEFVNHFTYKVDRGG